MPADFLATVVLPSALAFIMFTLGSNLTPQDFKRVYQFPRAFFVGLVCHFLLLPLVMFGLLNLFEITGAMAIGYMIISACPTGATSNLLTYHARADVALAVSFTAVASLLAMVTVPLILGWSMAHFAGTSSTFQLPAELVVQQIFMIVVAPVGLGMLYRAKAFSLAHRWHTRMSNIATLLFVLIVIAAVAKNWVLIKTSGLALVPMGIAINTVMLLIGFSLSRLTGVSLRQSATVAIESSIQNSTLAVVIAFTILKVPEMAVPAAVYSVSMYAVGLLFVFAMRRSIPAYTLAEEVAARAASH